MYRNCSILGPLTWLTVIVCKNTKVLCYDSMNLREIVKSMVRDIMYIIILHTHEIHIFQKLVIKITMSRDIVTCNLPVTIDHS